LNNRTGPSPFKFEHGEGFCLRMRRESKTFQWSSYPPHDPPIVVSQE
jgi:hypothetical protein